MNRNMRKMFTEQQIAEIVKKNSTKLYELKLFLNDSIMGANTTVIIKTTKKPQFDHQSVHLHEELDDIIRNSCGCVIMNGNDINCICTIYKDVNDTKLYVGYISDDSTTSAITIDCSTQDVDDYDIIEL